MVPQQNHLLNDWPIFGLQLMFNHIIAIDIIIGTKVPVQKSDLLHQCFNCR